jgi:hypothetical protein
MKINIVAHVTGTKHFPEYVAMATANIVQTFVIQMTLVINGVTDMEQDQRR